MQHTKVVLVSVIAKMPEDVSFEKGFVWALFRASRSDGRVSGLGAMAGSASQRVSAVQRAACLTGAQE